MSEFDYPEKKIPSSEELKELQGKECKLNLAILLKDKEIARLKSQLQEIEQKISQNKKSYSGNNTKAVLLHPFLIEEFESYRKDLQDTHSKINSLGQENFFKRNSESNPSTILKHAVEYMDKTCREIQSEITPEKIESYHSNFEKKQKSIAELEQKLKESRAYIKHLETEISESEDLIMLLYAKINQIDQQCSELRKENEKLLSRSKKY